MAARVDIHPGPPGAFGGGGVLRGPRARHTGARQTRGWAIRPRAPRSARIRRGNRAVVGGSPPAERSRRRRRRWRARAVAVAAASGSACAAWPWPWPWRALVVAARRARARRARARGRGPRRERHGGAGRGARARRERVERRRGRSARARARARRCCARASLTRAVRVVARLLHRRLRRAREASSDDCSFVSGTSLPMLFSMSAAEPLNRIGCWPAILIVHSIVSHARARRSCGKLGSSREADHWPK